MLNSLLSTIDNYLKSNKITYPHKNYRTPSDWLLGTALKAIGRSDHVRYVSLVQAMSDYISHRYRSLNEIAENEGFLLGKKETVISFMIKEFIKGIDTSKISGSPAMKAIAALLALDLACDTSSKYTLGQKISNKSLNDYQKGRIRKEVKNVTEKANKILDDINDLSASDLEITEDIRNEKKGEFAIPPEWEAGKGGSHQALENIIDYTIINELASMTTTDAQALNIGCEIEQVTEFKATESKVKEFDMSSRKKTVIKMQSYSQLHSVLPSDMISPLADYKLATKSMRVVTGIKQESKVKRLMLLVDKSGSMNNEFKRAWRNAVVKDRCKYIMNHGGELIYYHYVEYLLDKRVVTNKKQAKKLYEYVRKIRPNGGNTQIAKVLQRCIDEITKEGTEFDLAILMDGQDDFLADSIQAKGVKVHAIIIGQPHLELEKFALSTGGTVFLKELKSRQEYGSFY